MSPNFGVLTLGDAMITFNPLQSGPLQFVSQFERKVGGAELNFAIACSRLGLRSKWISRLGKDEFGRFIYNFVRGEGVDMEFVSFVEGHPTSLNFKEIRQDGSGKTFYYRFHSPILTLEPEDITEKMFEGVDLVHISGVFLAIAPKNILIVKRLLEIARQKRIPVSFDPNIRLKLWSIEDARSAYFDIFPYVDILLTGQDEIQLIMETSSDKELEDLANRYQISELVIKDGANGSRVYYRGVWYQKDAFLVDPVDTVGAGDGFDAGYVYGYLRNDPIEERLEFANGVGALVTTVLGDNEGLPYLEEVQTFIRKEAIIER
jgi:2-dehydro-3-deoxygluconokinase